MYKIGDNVVYGSNGVMTVVDMRDEAFGNISRTYYVLKAPCENSDSLTFVPRDNEKLVSAMRPLLMREEIESLILSSDEIPLLDFIEDNRQRAESFKRIIEEGDRTKLISLIKSVLATGARRNAEGKKNYLADEAAMRKAEHVLYSEMAVVFGVAEESVPELIMQMREKAKI